MKKNIHASFLIEILLFFCCSLSIMLLPDRADAHMVKTSIAATYPSYVGFIPSMNKIYTASNGGTTVEVIDGGTNTLSATIPITQPIVGLLVNPHNKKIYTRHAGFSGLPGVTEIDGGTNVATFVSAVSGNVTGIAVNTVTDSVYVSRSGTNSLLAINGTTITATVPVGSTPVAVAVDETRNMVYVANGNSNTVTVISGASDTVAATVTVGTYPIALAVNETANKVYIANYNSSNVSVINGADLTAAPVTITAGTNPQVVAVNQVTNKIYVADNTALTVINGVDNTTATLPVYAAKLAINTSANVVYAAANPLIIIDGATNTISRLMLTANSVAVDTASTFAYVASSTTVQIIDSNIYALTVGVVGAGGVNGTVTVIPVNSGPYPSGTLVTMTATPPPGTYFNTWNGSACNGNISTVCMVTMDATKNITANYTSTPPAMQTWSNSLGTIGTEDVASVVQQTADGGYVMAGNYGYNGGVTRNYWVVKMNADGTVAWQKQYGGKDNFNQKADEWVASIQQLGDGGYILTGRANVNGGSRGWVMRLDASGTHIWNRAFGSDTAVYDSLSSVIQSADGGFIAAGGSGGSFWLVKIASDGTTEWQKYLGAGGSDKIIQTTDGGYIIGGGDGTSAVLHKVDADGTIAWRAAFGKTGNTYEIASVVQNADGSYTVAGYSNPAYSAGNNTFIAKIDAAGAIVWQQSYGDTAVTSMSKTFDGGYIMAGSTPVNGSRDALLIKVDSSGNLLWNHTYGGAGSIFDYGSAVQPTVDGGYILVGQTQIGTGMYVIDAWLMKLDSAGQMSGNAATAISTPVLVASDPGLTATKTIPVAADSSGNKFAKIFAMTVTDTTAVPVPVSFAGSTFSVNFAVAPAGTGTLTGTASQTGISSGGSATAVTANANPGYSFVNWTGAGFTTTTTNPLTVTNVTANLNIAANFADSTPPTISIGAPSATLTKSGPITYTVTYADANFSAATVASGNISLNTTGSATASIAVTGSGTTRTVTLSSITGDGTLGISIAAGTASDLTGNLAPAAGPSATFTVDNTPPTAGGSGVLLSTITSATGPYAITTDALNVYWTFAGHYPSCDGSVMKVSKSGGAVTTLATGLCTPYYLATDGINLYWAEYAASAIKKIGVNGGAITTIASTQWPVFIATDGVRVYWTNNYAVNGTGGSVSVNGGAVTNWGPASGQWGSGPLTIDATDVYWIYSVNGTLNKTPKGGSSSTQLLSGINAAIMAQDANNIYWTQQEAPGTLKVIPKSGGSPTILASGLNTPGGVAVDSVGGYIYWLEQGTAGNNYTDGTVKMMPLGGGPITTLASGMHDPYTVTLDASGTYFNEVGTAPNYTDGVVRKLETVAIKINGGASLTNSQNVTLTLSAVDASGVAQMQFSNDGATFDAPVPFAASAPWTLSAGDGSKTVYVKFIDVVGNASSPFTASIYLDTSAPSSDNTLTATPGNGQVSLSWTAASDNVGVTGYKLVFDTANALAATCTNGTLIDISGGQPVVHTSLTSGVTYYYRVCATDAAGNWSVGATVTATPASSDSTAPTGTIAINPAATYTNVLTINLTISCNDAGSGCSQMQFSNNGTSWSTPEAVATSKSDWALSAGDELKTVSVMFQDAVGNWSIPYSATITLDTTPPAPPVSGARSVFTIASGLMDPRGVVVDADGVYFGEAGSNNDVVNYSNTDGRIRKVGKYGGNVTTLATGLTYPAVVASDKAAVYWSYSDGTNSGSYLKSVAKTGGAITTLVTGMNGSLMNAAVDATNIYWLETGTPYSGWSGTNDSAVNKIAKDGTGTKVSLVSNVKIGYGSIAIDSSYVYWAGYMGSNVGKIGQDGSNPVTLATGDYPTTIKVDATNVYWLTGGGTISKMNKDGSGQQYLTSAPSWNNGSMTIDDTNVYWMESGYTALKSIPKTGGTVTTLLTGLPGVGIVADATGIYWSERGTLANNYTDGSIKKLGYPSAIVINSGAATAISQGVTLTLAAQDANGVANMQFSNDGTTFDAAVTYATSAAWNLAAGVGVKTVYVKFQDIAGNWSAPYSASTLYTTAPGAPTSVTAAAGNTQTTVSFSAPADGGSPITGYTVVSAPAGGTDSNAGTTGLSHIITGLANGTTYTFTVTATNTVGAGLASAASNSVTPSIPPPAAPIIGTATPGNSQATITWNPVSGATYYNIYRSTTSGVQGTLVGSSTTTSYIDTTAVNGTTYYYTVTASDSTQRVYVANEVSFNTSVIDTATNTVSATINATGNDPTNVAINSQTNRAYVTNVYGNSVDVINTNTNTVVATITGLSGPNGVAVNPLTNRAYVTNGTPNTVSVIDTTSNTIIATISGMSAVASITVNPLTNRAYVTSWGGSTVYVINTTDNTVVANVGVGLQSARVAVNPQTSRAYVTNYSDNTISVVDITNNTVVTTITGVTTPSGIAVDPQTNRVYVTNLSGNTVSVIDATSNAVVKTIPVGSLPSSIVVIPQINRAYVPGQGGGVSVIDTTTNTVVTTVTVGTLPLGLDVYTVVNGGEGASSSQVSVTPVAPVTTAVVSPSAGANGTISPSTPQTITSGSSASFTITSNSGYSASVGGTCGGSLVGTTFTTNAVSADCTVVASFTSTVPPSPTASITNTPVTYNSFVQTATVACLGGGTATLASGGSGTNAGSYPATVDCAASTNYSAASGLSAGNFAINKADAAISWPTASVITYGQTLAASTLNGGTATPAGAFAFTTLTTAPTAGTAAQSVTFTPNDSANFNITTGTVSVTVNKANPVITWANPTAINSGTALSATQLNAASGGIAGTFAYTPPSGTVLNAGAGQTLSVTFTPTDIANFNGQSATTAITVIFVDTTAPDTTFTAPTTAPTRAVAITLSATDAAGVTGYLLKDTAVPPLATDPDWMNTPPTSYTFRTWGNNILYAYAKDAAGNISAPKLTVVLIGPTDGIIVPAAQKLEPTLEDALRSLNFAMKVMTPTPEEFAGANVSPLVNGIPQPPGNKTMINLGDTIVTLRRVIGL
ncbi:MAG TPA: hypothetical protein HPP97_08230 [Desulfuromonadales bacterium]|nr:hypothetical protein [Desulfuromonadales bacterium]